MFRPVKNVQLVRLSAMQPSLVSSKVAEFHPLINGGEYYSQHALLQRLLNTATGSLCIASLWNYKSKREKK